VFGPNAPDELPVVNKTPEFIGKRLFVFVKPARLPTVKEESINDPLTETLKTEIPAPENPEN
jgi:hypothetical protein